MTQDQAGTRDVQTYLTKGEKSQFAGRAVDVIDHWQGEENLLWRVNADGVEAVVKMYLEAGQARSRRQFEAQALFAPAGLAPAPLWFDWDPQPVPRPVLVYEWIDGDPLDLSDPFQREALAATLARIHRTPPEGIDIFSPHPVNLSYFWQIWQGSRGPIQRWLSDVDADRVLALFRQLWMQVERLMQTALPIYGETPPALIHGDLRPENALMHRGRALLLDWELFGIGDPAQEIARFLFFHQQQMSAEWQAEWLQMYWQQGGDPELEGRIALYRQLFPFHSLTFLLNGIQRELVNDPSQYTELAENRRFLVETIASTLLRAAERMLGTGDVANVDEVKAEIEQLLTPPTNPTTRIDLEED